MTPRVSIVIAAGERTAALVELVHAVLRQRDAPPFEVVIVEVGRAGPTIQLPNDPRVRVLRPQLDHTATGRRNIGARAARGDILVFLDERDLPAGDRWLAAHVACFDDPMCIAAAGRRLVHGAEPHRLARARRRVCSFVPLLRWPRRYTHADRRCAIEALPAGNTAIRRSILARVGLWDECGIDEELSLSLRLHGARRAGEFLVFEPDALVMHARPAASFGIAEVGARAFVQLHRVLAFYAPARVVVFYPMYILLIFLACRQAIASRRVRRTLALLFAFPVLWSIWTIRLARSRRDVDVERAPPLGRVSDSIRPPTGSVLTSRR